MPEPMIREYVTADVPELIRLWTGAFDDTGSFCEKFFLFLPDIGSGVVAVTDGKIVGAAYSLNGQELVDGEKRAVVGYIYGVAVYEQYRHKGIGESLVKAVFELSKKRGAVTVTTLPAEKSLYGWYEKIAGFKYTLKCEKLVVKSGASEAVMPVTSTEYMMMRESMLRGKVHIHPSSYALEFEKKLLNEYGGDLFMTESGLCAAYPDNGRAMVREVIAPDREAALRVAESVGAFLKVNECEVRLPASDGVEYVLSDKLLPADCIWNLTFD